MGSRISTHLRTDSFDDARSDLVETLGWYITDEDGAPDAAAIETRVTDQVAEEWWRVAGNRREQRHMLLRLGVDRFALDEDLLEVGVALYISTWKPNPAHHETEQDPRAGQSKLAAQGIGSLPEVRVPSIPMSITECAEYLSRGLTKRNPDAKPFFTPRRVRRLMDSGPILFEKHGRESFTFCCTAFPGLPSRQGE